MSRKKKPLHPGLNEKYLRSQIKKHPLMETKKKLCRKSSKTNTRTREGQRKKELTICTRPSEK